MSGKRIKRSYSKKLSSPCEAVFPLLCPVREYEWIPVWKCEIIYTKSGYAELGCVFKTDFADNFSGPETWVICTYEKNRVIGFIKTAKHTVTRYNVSLEKNGAGSTIRWDQELTSLDETGDLLLEKITGEVYEAKMGQLNELLDYFLQHGATRPQL